MAQTSNGMSFADTIGNLFNSGAKLATGIADIGKAFNPPKTTTIVQPAIIQPATQAQPAGGFKMDQTTLMMLAGVGILVLVVTMK
jgi:hypothetical protein